MFGMLRLVDQDALRVRLFNLQAMSQWEWMRNVIGVRLSLFIIHANMLLRHCA